MSTQREDAASALPDHLYLIGCDAGSPQRPLPADVSAQMLGFKAFNLLKMAALGLRVPPAFVLGTPYCGSDEMRARATGASVWRAGISRLERATGRRFGDPRVPLFVSVRSGAPVSMPGMMDTLLNIGLCERTLGGLLRQTGNPRLAWDTYRRLIRAWGELVSGVPEHAFDEEYKRIAGSRDERSLDFTELRTLAHRYLAVHESETGKPFPQDPAAQLEAAISQVLASWHSDRACEYRRQFGLDDTPGTAVTVQTMVFGNAGGRSGAGVAFTRSPLDGEPALWADFLFNAQGEDVVSGRRVARGHETLAQALPPVWTALRDSAAALERALGDMQDIEFTVQDGQLYLLQTRAGKRSARAAARIALDMLDEGLITANVARERTASLDLASLVTVRLANEDGQTATPLAHAASGNVGVTSGEIALDTKRAIERGAQGAVVLLRQDADTADIAALQASTGLLTRNGTRTAHAAVVARQMGKVCLVGCPDLVIDEVARSVRFGDTTLREGDPVTLDGDTGAVYAGAMQTVTEPLVDLQQRLLRLRSQ
ncbi:PEP/pyruvate-binding domain-containing protein [Paraburkholderia lycopersici]|uniref:Pyruvate, orthophosphate dikinase n=1 Tax=Paraburkholderia lycopersici TaxID=416944 RepID=A0A1G6QT23_9BURK|nr:PEP/pyruvate-binding domain-containing protein [Paraburkholderia lycopersici]SDC94857.1 pyruvate, orthophosphate dikinase [Paraburkholderia lycopersici]